MKTIKAIRQEKNPVEPRKNDPHTLKNNKKLS